MTALRTQHFPEVPLAWVGHVLSEHQEVYDLGGRLSKAFYRDRDGRHHGFTLQRVRMTCQVCTTHQTDRLHKCFS